MKKLLSLVAGIVLLAIFIACSSEKDYVSTDGLFGDFPNQMYYFMMQRAELPADLVEKKDFETAHEISERMEQYLDKYNEKIASTAIPVEVAKGIPLEVLNGGITSVRTVSIGKMEISFKGQVKQKEDGYYVMARGFFDKGETPADHYEYARLGLMMYGKDGKPILACSGSAVSPSKFGVYELRKTLLPAGTEHDFLVTVLADECRLERMAKVATIRIIDFWDHKEERKRLEQEIEEEYKVYKQNKNKR